MRSDIVIVLQARMASTRLPGKVLAPLGDGTVVSHCLKRLRASRRGPVVLATTVNREDDALAEEADRLGIDVVRGADADVLSRFGTIALRTNADIIVRATADNPAVDIDAVGRTVDALTKWRVDYAVETGLPYGTAVEAVTASALLDADRRASDPADREHVTTFVKRECARYPSINPSAPAALCRPELRLTIDTPADLVFMGAVVRAMPISLSVAPLSTIIRAARRAAVADAAA